MRDTIRLALSCGPKSIGDAEVLIIVYLLIVATVFRPGIQAMTLLVTLSSRNKTMSFMYLWHNERR